MSVRIGGTLGDASVVARATTEMAWIHGCTAKERAAWVDVHDYMKNNPGATVSRALKQLRISPCLYYNAKKKAEASSGEALSHGAFNNKDLIRPGDTVVKNAERAEREERRGTPPPKFAPKQDLREDPEPAAVQDAPSGPQTVRARMDPNAPAKDKIALYDDVQIKMEELGCSEEAACEELLVLHSDYLEAKVVARAAEEKLVLERQDANKNMKTIAWERSIHDGMAKGVEAVALKMRAGLLDVAAISAPTDPMKALMTVLQILNPMSPTERRSVLFGAAAFFGEAL